MILVAEWPFIYRGTMIAMDSSTFFYPMYSYLGARLRQGQIPAWNPYQLSGVPFAADPQSGWMYLPAMLLFALLPLSLAAKSYMLLHLMLAAAGLYLLARTLGLSAWAGVVAGMAYSLNGFLYLRNLCCFPYPMVMAWLPWTILGAELGLRSTFWSRRIFWWGMSGFGLSQMLAGWIGQGAYYALILVGGYLAYRTVFDPPVRYTLRRRLVGLVLHGAAVLVAGFGLAAAGLLPRLEYNRLSSLAGGYDGQATGAALRGWSFQDWSLLLARGGGYYAGILVLGLALLALGIARGRYLTPLWTAAVLVGLVLTAGTPGPLHRLMYALLPAFSRLHPHNPERITMIIFLPLSLLAGATLTDLGRYGRRILPLLGLVPALLLLLYDSIAPLQVTTVAVVLVGFSLLSLMMLLPAQRSLMFALLALVLFADLYSAQSGVIARWLTVREGEGARRVSLQEYYRPTGAALFLMSKLDEGAFRFFGYDQAPGKAARPYQLYFARMGTAHLLVNNRGMTLGLQDIQGYNPVQIAAYPTFIRSLNGVRQGYRNEDVLNPGLDSPLLDLLNVRYIIVPARMPEGRSDLLYALYRYRTVYRGGGVRVLERRTALPRAWLVHSARRVAPPQALRLLASGEIDPRTMAVLQQPPPVMSVPPNPVAGADKVEVMTYEPERIVVRSTSTTRGLLVLSEMYYPLWKAYVDGRPTPIMPADYLLRAVYLQGGTHLVELRYESMMLRVGIVISALFYLALGLAGVGCGRSWWSYRRVVPA